MSSFADAEYVEQHRGALETAISSAVGAAVTACAESPLAAMADHVASIADAGAIPLLVSLLRGSPEVHGDAAGALWSLAAVLEHRDGPRGKPLCLHPLTPCVRRRHVGGACWLWSPPCCISSAIFLFSFSLSLQMLLSSYFGVTASFFFRLRNCTFMVAIMG